MLHEVRHYKYSDKESRKNGKWINKDLWTGNVEYTLYPEDYVGLEETASENYTLSMKNSIYTGGRNYALFGILANVRWTPPVTIHEPKGIPTNCSYQTMGEIMRYGSDGHSHSWLTLRELEEFDWNITEVVSELMTEAGLEILREEIGEESIISIEEKNNLKAVTYHCPLSKFAGSFYTETIPKLREHLDSYSSITEDDIRVVFFFDS
jgi:hypothetical protein